MESKKFELGPLGANAYVVTCQNETAVIDPGDVSEALLQYLQSLENIKYVLLTHCHCDHIAGADTIRNLFGAQIAIHTEDAPFWNQPAGNLANRMGGLYSIETYPKADILLKDGDKLSLGASEITVLHTPGHTRGGVCFALDGVLFTGDTLMQGSMGRFDFPGGDRSVLFNSLRMLKNLDTDYKICPGHGADTTLSAERQSNPYLLFLE